MSQALPSPRRRPLVHEAIWAPMLAAMFVVARFAPDSAFSVLFCPFRIVTDLPCLACGGTRAMRALARLDFATAFTMNPLVAVGGIAAAIYVLHALRVAFVTHRPWVLDPAGRPFRAARLWLVAAVAANWAYLIAVGR